MNDTATGTTEPTSRPVRPWYRMEDYVAMGIALLFVLLAGLWAVVLKPDNASELAAKHRMTEQQLSELSKEAGKEREELLKSLKGIESKLAIMPLKDWLGRPGEWKQSPAEAFQKGDKSLVPGILVSFITLLVVFAAGERIFGNSAYRFAVGFCGLFAIAVLAYLLAGQVTIKYYSLEYALWALLLGLLISNTVGLPDWLKFATKTEFYIKTGLVLLGAEVLLNKLLALGIPGILISWVVTPIVLISTYLFGQYVLKIPSKSLNLVISADMSVCGVSAAVATAAACKAKKEELSLAIGLSLVFTVIMIVVQPLVVKWTGMGEVIGGAWIGGTIDSTGAVAAAGELVGKSAKEAATTIKMIQNILIGVVAFAVAVYWTTFVEPRREGVRPSAWEIWKRFPRFTLGFIGMSLLLSFLQSQGIEGRSLVSSIVDGATKSIREWLFCLAFVSIGLESNFREYRHMLASGKPLVLYLCGQALNLTLSFLMAWLVFTKLFPAVLESLSK